MLRSDIHVQVVMYSTKIIMNEHLSNKIYVYGEKSIPMIACCNNQKNFQSLFINHPGSFS